MRKLSFIFILTAAFFIFGFTGCQIGLGSSVDIERPSVDIVYPPSSSIIRDSFILAGSCSDDYEIKSVSVTVKNIKTKKSYGPYDAVLDEKKKNWTVELNSESSAETAADLSGDEKSWTFPDGTYEIQAVAVDEADKESDPGIRTFEIDNTAPLFFLETPFNTDYGTSFSVTGYIDEDHVTSTLALNVYDQDGNLLTQTPFTQEDIERKVDNIFALYRQGQTGTLQNRYLALYGSELDGKTRSYTAKILVSDNAKLYQNPSETANTTTGNQTSIVYPYAKVYTQYISEKASATFTYSEIGDILNGTYDGTADTTQTAAVKKFMEENKIDTASSSLLNFTLNSDRNPTYTMNSLDISQAAQLVETVTLDGTNSVNFVISKGRNNTSLDYSSIKIWYKELTTIQASSISSIKTAFSDFLEAINQAAEAADSEDSADSTAAASSGTAADSTATTDSSIKQFAAEDITISQGSNTGSVKLTNAGIKAGVYYLIALTGTDLDGYALNPQQGAGGNGETYAFTGRTATQPPSCDISSPDLDAYFNNSDFCYEGTFFGQNDVTSVSYSVTVYDQLNKRTIGIITGNAELTYEEGKGKRHGTWKSPLMSDTSKNAYGLKDGEEYNEATAAEDINKLLVTKDSGNQYSYQISVWAMDDTGNKSSYAQQYEYLDSIKPVLKINTINPLVVKDKTCVNGIITVSGNISERSSLASVSYQAYKNFGDAETAAGDEIFLETTQNFSFDFDTASAGLADNTDFKLKIFAVDAAGNRGETDTTAFNESCLFINQSTDKPVVLLTNTDQTLTDSDEIGTNKNLFGITGNNNINGTVSDDDGVKQITIKFYKKGTKEIVKQETKAAKGAASFTFNFKTPETEGIYDVELLAEDINSTPVTSTQSFIIGVAENAPGIYVTSPVNDTFCTANLTVSGTYTGSVKTIVPVVYKKQSDGTFVSYEAAGTEEKKSYPFAGTVSLSDGTWSVPVTMNVPQTGTYRLSFKATNEYGLSSTGYVVYKVDINKPYVSILESSLPDTQTTEAISFQITGSASDITDITNHTAPERDVANESGIKKVQIAFGENPAEVHIYEATGTAEWTYTVYPTDENKPELAADFAVHGPMKVYVRAIDNAGNAGEWVSSKEFIYDTKKPDVAVTSTVTQAKDEYTVSVKASDDYGIKAVTAVVSKNGGEAAAIEPAHSDGSDVWSYTTKPESDGTYTYTFTATDLAGKTTAAAVSVIYDTTNPEVKIESPAHNSWISESANILRGTVKDAGVGVASMSYSLTKKDESNQITSIEIIRSGESWSIGTEDNKVDVGENEGTFLLKVKAVDALGTESDEVTSLFYFDKNYPELTETSVGASGKTVSGQYTLSGTASDSNGLKSLVIKEDGIDTIVKEFDVSEVSKAGGIWSFEVSNPSEGKHSYSITATDVVDKPTTVQRVVEVDKNAPSVTITNWPSISDTEGAQFTVSGTGSDEAGTYNSGLNKVELSFDSAAEKTKIFQASGTTTWTYSINPSDAELASYFAASGTKTVYVRAADRAENVSEWTAKDFIYDTKKPEIKNTTAVTMAKAAFTVSAAASDDWGIASVSATQAKDNGEAASITLSHTDNTSVWSYEAAPDSDGTYTYEFKAVDLAGKEKTVTAAVVYDTTAPAISILSPVNNSTVSNQRAVLQGTVAENGSGLESFVYVLKNGETVISEEDITSKVANGSWKLTGPANADGSEGSGLDLGTGEGELTLILTAKDKLGNGTAELSDGAVAQSVFYYDLNIPEITETGITESSRTTNAGFTLQGQTWDTNRISYITIKDDVTGTIWNSSEASSDINWTDSSTGTSKTYGGKDWSKAFVTGDDNKTQANYAADGKHTYTITAYDVAGKSYPINRTVVVDTVNPVSEAFVVDSDKLKGTTIIFEENPWKGSGIWYNTKTISIKVSASDTDGSGVAAVAYSTDYTPATAENPAGGSWASLTKNAAAGLWTSDVTVENQGANSIWVKITDAAGNETVTAPLTVYVDTIGPDSFSVEVDGEAGFDGNKILNRDNDLTVKVTASDASTYIKSVKAYTTIITAPAGENLSSADFTISSADFASAQVVFTVEDILGNKSEFSPFRLTVDTVIPVAQINALEDKDALQSGIQINGVINISGTASDSNGIAAVELQYKKTDGTWAEVPRLEGHAQTGTTSWTYEKVDTAAEELNPDGQDVKTTLVLRAKVTDVAGNVGYSAETSAILDHDSDRPVIRVNNMGMSGMTGTTPFWHKLGYMYGIVSDDDGSVQGIYVSLTGNEGEWSDNCFDSGSWSYDFTNGLAAGETCDGSKVIYFKVVDKDGTAFVSNSNSTAYGSYGPKIIDKTGSVKFGYADTTPATPNDILYTTIDTKNPEFTGIWYNTTKGLTGETAVAAEWQELGPKFTCGPNQVLNIKYSSADKNGIYKSTVALGSGTDTSTYTTLDTSDSDDYSGTYAKFLKVENGAENQTVYASFDISKAAGITAGLQKLILTVSDNSSVDSSSGVVSKTYEIISVDNEAPVVEFRSPNPNTVEYGSVAVTVSGKITDDNAEVINGAKAYFAVTTTSEAPALDSGKWTRFDEYVSYNLWTISFDEDLGVNLNDPAVPSTIYHATKLNQLCYLDDHGNYSEAAANEGNVKTAYIWVYATDDFENVSTPEYLPVSVNPIGDKPTVTISYPDDGSKLGGTIRIYGTTDIAVSSVASIWLQIDPDYNAATGFASDWKSKLTAVNGDNPVGYTILDSVRGSDAGVASSSSYYSTELIAGGIKASGSAVSWNLPVNVASEYTKINGKNRVIAVRAYAVSETGKVSDAVVCTCEVDPDSPVFGDTAELRLVQYDEEGNETASKKYEADAWIRGQWYLVGSVADAQGIQSIVYREGDEADESGTAAKEILTNADTKDWFTPYGAEIDGCYNYLLKIPVGNVTPDKFGTLKYTLVAMEGSKDKKTTTATITLNYDNKAPEFAAALAATDNEIFQSDGVYTIDGTYKEESSADGNQSGFKRIAMFFTRSVGGVEKYLIDPMISGGVGEGKDNFTDISTLTEKNGLLTVKSTGAKLENANELTVTSVPSGVRTGGIVFINDIGYRISSINDKVIRVEGSLVSAENMTVYFALAQIIDNQSIETISNSSLVHVYGSGDDPVTNGDGDWMIEGVSHAGGNYTWTVSINSRNIYDGSININFVAYDDAENFTKKVYTGKIRNNNPRIAGVSYGADDNGNGIVDAKEMITAYSGLYNAASDNRVSGVVENGKKANGQYVTSLDSTVITERLNIKGKMVVVPEIVGGNTGLGYDYEYTNQSSERTKTSIKTFEGVGHSTTSDIRDAAGTTVTIDVMEFLKNKFADGEQSVKFTIYDKTDWSSDTGYGADCNKADFTIPVNVNLKDKTKPKVHIKPFYWNASDDNSMSRHLDADSNKWIMDGHVELEADWAESEGYLSTKDAETGKYAVTGELDADPKVSGRIILDCQASDENFITKLEILVPGLNGSSDYITAATRNSDGVMVPATDVNGNWSVTIVDDTVTNQDGNVVTWQFEFDTSAVTGTVALDLGIKARVYDRGSVALNADETAIVYAGENASEDSSVQTAKDSMTSYYKVDVVPYITGLTTALGTYNSNLQRSTSGKYSVLASEAGIIIHGFNLGNSPKLYHSYYDSVTAADIRTEITGITGNGSTISGISLGDIAASGSLEIDVKDSDSNTVINLNNKNKNPVFDASSSTGNKIDSAAYNSMAVSSSNNHLDDDVELLIWESKNIAEKQSADLEHPVVKINPANGDIGASFLNQYFFNMPAKREEDRTGSWITYTQTPMALGFTGYNSGTFAWDSNGVTYGLYQNMVTDNAGQGGFFDFVIGRAKKNGTTPTNFNFSPSTMNYADAYRQPVLGVRLEGISTTLLKTDSIESKGTTYTPYTNAFYNPEAWSFNSKRIMSPVVSAKAGSDGTAVYIAYADTTTNQIRFRRGTLHTDSIMSSSLNLDNAIGTAYGQAMATAYTGSNSMTQHMQDNSLRDVYDFDTNYSLSNSYTKNCNVTFGYDSEKTNYYSSNVYVYTYPYLNTEHKAYRTPGSNSGNYYYQVEAADSLATLSGQTVHVVASSGAEGTDIADIYKKSSGLHNYANSAGKYVGLDVTSDGTAVVAWQDEDSDSLKVSYMTDSQMDEAETTVKTTQDTTAINNLTAPKLTTFTEGSYNTTSNQLGLTISFAKVYSVSSALSGVSVLRGTYKIKDGIEYKFDDAGNFVIDENGDYVFKNTSDNTTVYAADAYELDASGNKQFTQTTSSNYKTNNVKSCYTAIKAKIYNSSDKKYYDFTAEVPEDKQTEFQTQLKYVTDYTEALNKMYNYYLQMLEPLNNYKAALDSLITEYKVTEYPDQNNTYLDALLNNDRTSEAVKTASQNYSDYLTLLTNNYVIMKDILLGTSNSGNDYSDNIYYKAAIKYSNQYENNYKAVYNTFATIAANAANTTNQGLKYFATASNRYAAAQQAIEDCLIAYYRVYELTRYSTSLTAYLTTPYSQLNTAINALTTVRNKFSSASGKTNGFYTSYTELLEEYSKSAQLTGDITYSSTDDSGVTHYSTAAQNSAARTSVWENHTKSVDAGGEYVQVVVDSDNHVHMAYYSRGALKYAYMKSASSSPKVYTVDTVDSPGEYLTLNVGKDSDGNQIPYIGYYGSGHAKYAVFNADYLKTGDDGSISYANGSVSSLYTGAWEITAVPTVSAIKQDNVNVAVWVDNDGAIEAIPAGTDISKTNANLANPGNSTKVYANGTMNPVIAYINKSGSLEMSQIK